MAFESIEASYIGEQLRNNIARMVNNMRDNANAYKTAVIAGKPVAALAAAMVVDANEFLRRLAMVRDLAQRNTAKFQAAITSNGWTASDFNALRNALLATCDHIKAAPLTTLTEITTEADFILANVPNFERTF